VGALDGRVAVLTGSGTALGAGIGAALTGEGAHVHALDASFPWASRADAEGALAGAGDTIDVVVHAAVVPEALVSRPFADVDDAAWESIWEGTMRTSLWLCQAAFPYLRDRSGRIVFVLPTVSMSGAANLAPLAAATEAQRLLAKSAARQWGPNGITVNCLAAAPELVVDGVRSDSLTLSPPALGGPGDPQTDLGPAVVFLASDAGHFVTGATICADGGVWMAP
jgi:NAD(P)-dependent dehydrogenase (short-subunit alcohol dehydrogenase family)